MKLNFKKPAGLVFSAAVFASLLCFSAMASEGADKYKDMKPGAHLIADSASPTGYKGVFIYDDKGEHGELTKVELYSDCMLLYSEAEQKSGSIDKNHAHKPEDYRAGLYPAGGNGDNTYVQEMQRLENGFWAAEVPLSSGAFVYNFRVADVNGKVTGRLDDPANPTLLNKATGIHSLSSMIYVPYSADTMGNEKWADRSVELRVKTPDKKGRVETVSYTGAAGDLRGLGVYLPAGYDKNREEPYKVLYLSHGMSGDVKGNELRWLHEGAVANIMDNLISEGKTEPFVVITMNNQDFRVQGETRWDQDKIWAEQELIMRKAEADYNIYKTAEGRAFAGLSMGGLTTSTILRNHPDEFSYYGVWSYAATDRQELIDALKGKNIKISLAAGKWDFGLEQVNMLAGMLNKAGVQYYNNEVYTVPAAHDWEAWQLIYAEMAEKFFWRN